MVIWASAATAVCPSIWLKMTGYPEKTFRRLLLLLNYTVEKISWYVGLCGPPDIRVRTSTSAPLRLKTSQSRYDRVRDFDIKSKGISKDMYSKIWMTAVGGKTD